MSFQEYAESNRSKLRLGTTNPRLLIGAAVIALLVVACIAFALFDSTSDSGGFEVVSAERQEPTSREYGAEAPQKEVCVHVGGCVVNPGIRYLKEGDRVADAVEAAGGMTEEAASDSLNLARVVSDGEQIIVASRNSESAQSSEGTPSSSAQPSSGKVNINTASLAELQTISGIGESKAKKIIEYREKSGSFKNVDELTKVSGIGEKTLDSIRDSVCV